MSSEPSRIHTTHVGSLPRSAAVTEMLFQRELGQPYSQGEFDVVMAQAVDEVVARQVRAGIDLVSDGETSKIGYATYIKDRLTGFEGDNPRQVAVDLKDYPQFRERMAIFAGKQTFKRCSCVGPVSFVGSRDLAADIDNLRKAVANHHPVGAFMNAASPGVVAAYVLSAS